MIDFLQDVFSGDRGGENVLARLDEFRRRKFAKEIKGTVVSLVKAHVHYV